MTINELQAYCTGFKGVTYDIKWGADLCYSIGGKMFCVIGTTQNHSVGFKTSPEEFIDLPGREGIIPAASMARDTIGY